MKPVVQTNLHSATEQEFDRLQLQKCVHIHGPRRSLLLSVTPASWVSGSEGPPTGMVGLFYRQIDVPGPAQSSSVISRFDFLPFRTDSFDLVVAQGVLGTGDEMLVKEIKRVLLGAGHLLVLGRGRWGSRHLREKSDDVIAVSPYRLCMRLEQRSFAIEHCEGHGLAGIPATTGMGITRPFVGVSDRIVVCARLREVRPIVTHVRFGRTQTMGARNVAAGNVMDASSEGAIRESAG